tara:strand:- start:60 stop:539 length:480 start_codon:yes stop_codon:yes gene_type:complete
MSISGQISVGWPIPTGLKVEKQKVGPGHIAIFSWNKISQASMISLDPSGGGYHDIYWRVKINDTDTYLVYTNPTFTISIPMGCCKLCVKVQAVFDLSGVQYTYGNLALSEFCDEVCVDCDPDLYCLSVKSKGNKTTTQNFGSANMRYARAIRNGVNNFR